MEKLLPTTSIEVFFNKLTNNKLNEVVNESYITNLVNYSKTILLDSNIVQIALNNINAKEKIGGSNFILNIESDKHFLDITPELIGYYKELANLDKLIENNTDQNIKTLATHLSSKDNIKEIEEYSKTIYKNIFDKISFKLLENNQECFIFDYKAFISNYEENKILFTILFSLFINSSVDEPNKNFDKNKKKD